MVDLRHEWQLNGLDMVKPKVLPKSGWWLETQADGFDLGSAEGVKVVLPSLFLDGDDVRLDRHGNRQPGWKVKVKGYTTEDLAQGERLLTQICSAINASREGGVLRWKPPDGVGQPSLFEVRVADLPKLIVKDLEWVPEGDKILSYTYTMSLECGPWALAAETVTESFAPGAGTITTVDACTANTNWPGMTTATYLSQSVVRKSTVGTGSTSGGWAFSGTDFFYRVPFVAGGAEMQVSYIGSVPAVTFVYLDVAFQIGVEGGGSGSLFMRDASTGSPIAFQALANGFTRYFWTRPTTGTVLVDVSMPAGNGETATINIDQFGTSTTLPSGSLYALNMRGSVRVPAQLVVHDPVNGLGETLVYADPTMLTHGWQPDLDVSWPSAPEGTYWLYVQPGLIETGVFYGVGDVFSYTLAGQTCTTRTEWAGLSTVTDGRWFPLGPFHLGTNRSRRLGVIPDLNDTVQLLCNGAAMDGSSKVRLIRSDPSASLLHVRLSESGEGAYLFVDPATFDQPRPGIYAGSAADGSDAVSVLDLTDSWAWPILQPPTPSLWIQAKGTTSPELTIVHRPAFNNFVAA